MLRHPKMKRILKMWQMRKDNNVLEGILCTHHNTSQHALGLSTVGNVPESECSGSIERAEGESCGGRIPTLLPRGPFRTHSSSTWTKVKWNERDWSKFLSYNVTKKKKKHETRIWFLKSLFHVIFLVRLTGAVVLHLIHLKSLYWLHDRCRARLSQRSSVMSLSRSL